MPLASSVFPLVVHPLPFHFASPDLVRTILYPSRPFRGHVETCGTNRWPARLRGQCSVTWRLTGDWSPVELLTPFSNKKSHRASSHLPSHPLEPLCDLPTQTPASDGQGATNSWPISAINPEGAWSFQNINAPSVLNKNKKPKQSKPSWNWAKPKADG